MQLRRKDTTLNDDCLPRANSEPATFSAYQKLFNCLFATSDQRLHKRGVANLILT